MGIYNKYVHAAQVLPRQHFCEGLVKQAKKWRKHTGIEPAGEISHPTPPVLKTGRPTSDRGASANQESDISEMWPISPASKMKIYVQLP